MLIARNSTSLNLLTLLTDHQSPRAKCVDLPPKALVNEKRRAIAGGIGINPGNEQSYLHCGSFGHTKGTMATTHQCNIRSYCPRCGVFYSERQGRDQAKLFECVLEAGRLHTGQQSCLIHAILTLPMFVHKCSRGCRYY